MVVAQLIEWVLPKPEFCSLNPVIGKNLYIEHLFTVNCIEKEKDAVNGPIFFKKNQSIDFFAHEQFYLIMRYQTRLLLPY